MHRPRKHWERNLWIAGLLGVCVAGCALFQYRPTDPAEVALRMGGAELRASCSVDELVTVQVDEDTFYTFGCGAALTYRCTVGESPGCVTVSPEKVARTALGCREGQKVTLTLDAKNFIAMNPQPQNAKQADLDLKLLPTSAVYAKMHEDSRRIGLFVEDKSGLTFFRILGPPLDGPQDARAWLDVVGLGRRVPADQLYFAQGCGESAFLLCPAGMGCRVVQTQAHSPHVAAAREWACAHEDVTWKSLDAIAKSFSVVGKASCNGKTGSYVCPFPDRCYKLEGSE